MDDAIWALFQQGIVSAHEAFMKAIDKNRFKKFLPSEEQNLGNPPVAVPDDEKRQPGYFAKRWDLARRDNNCRQLRAVSAEPVVLGLANAAKSNVTTRQSPGGNRHRRAAASK